jgi:hypothetical protein
MERSLRSLLRSLIVKLLIDNIFIERLGFTAYGNIQEETDAEKEKTIYHYFYRFHDSNTEPDSNSILRA